jgi:hypothetical protein
MDQLLRSHAELCATLRLAGRQMLQFEKQGDESLDRIRKVLRRADNVRKALPSPGEVPDGPTSVQDTLGGDAPVAGHSHDKVLNGTPIRKSVRKKPVPASHRTLRLITFPPG